MPVDYGFHVEIVGEIHAEPLAGVEHQSGPPRGVEKAENAGGAPADVDRAAGGAQIQGIGCRAGRRGNEQRECGEAGCGCRGGKEAAAGHEVHFWFSCEGLKSSVSGGLMSRRDMLRLRKYRGLSCGPVRHSFSSLACQVACSLLHLRCRISIRPSCTCPPRTSPRRGPAPG